MQRTNDTIIYNDVNMQRRNQTRNVTHGISFKIIVSVLGPLFFMGAAFLLIVIFSLSYWHFQTEKASINRFMAGYSAALKNAFDLSDFDYIKRSLGEIGEMTDMRNIGLFGAKGNGIALLSSQDQPFIRDATEIATTLESPGTDLIRTFKYKTRDAGTVFRNITMLPNQGSCLKCHDARRPILGFLMADFSTERVNRHFIIHILQIIIAALVSVFVIIIVLKVVLKKMIRQPLEAITTGLEGISIISGRIQQIEHSAQDEIGALVDAINSLAERHEYNKQVLSTFYDGVYGPISPLEYEMNVLASTKVEEVIEKDIETLYTNMTLKDVLAFIKRSEHTFFPVVNEWGEFAGVITLQDVRNVLIDPSMSHATKAQDFLRSDAAVLTPDQDLRAAMDLFNTRQVPYISVIDRETRLFLGILARRKVLEILKQSILRNVGI